MIGGNDDVGSSVGVGALGGNADVGAPSADDVAVAVLPLLLLQCYCLLANNVGCIRRPVLIFIVRWRL